MTLKLGFGFGAAKGSRRFQPDTNKFGLSRQSMGCIEPNHGRERVAS
jgi:hypothetical protein